MGTALTDRDVNESYKDLLQVSNANSGIDATLRAVSDGEGTESPLKLSSSLVSLNPVLSSVPDSAEWFVGDTGDSDRGYCKILFMTTQFSEVTDPIIGWGYNFDSSGAAKAGEQSLQWVIEGNYYADETHVWAETYLQYNNPAHTDSVRPLAIGVNTINDFVQLDIIISKASVYNHNQADRQDLLLTPDTWGTVIDLLEQSYFRGNTNNCFLVTQINEAGSAYVPLLGLSDSDWVITGNANATGFKIQNGPLSVGSSQLRGYTSSTAAPSTTEYPSDKDWGIHKDTNTGSVYLAYNDGGSTIKSVELT